jgi:hypothetical protein
MNLHLGIVSVTAAATIATTEDTSTIAMAMMIEDNAATTSPATASSLISHK